MKLVTTLRSPKISNSTGCLLKDLMDKHGVSRKMLYTEAGVSRSYLSDFLKGESVTKFHKVLDILKSFDTITDSNHEEILMKKFIAEMDEKIELIHGAMWYCDKNNYLKELDHLTRVAKSHHNEMLRETGRLYRINYLRKKEYEKLVKISNNSNNNKKRISRRNKLLRLLGLVEILKTSNTENRVLKKILKAYLKNDLQFFKETQAELTGIKKLFKEVEDNTLKITFEVKLNELLQFVSVRNLCDFEKAKEYSREGLAKSFSIKNDAGCYVTFGEADMFYNPDEAIKNFNKAIQLYDRIGMKEVAVLIMKKIQFTQIHWGFDVKLEEIIHEQNKAYWLIKHGRNKEAVEILDRIDSKDSLQAQRLWLRGLATSDPTYHWLSLEDYSNRGEKLFGKLPRNELIKLGENPVGVNALYRNGGF
ncbi:AimR family lysis-lysogeny pheromone receptor [Bacillus sp. SCS-151]|uniref:AimR family lysis-lysogeny pheromone receptor n=1 Tax=Nanhaiella sioensis TaxID=3115293 RepID=UPI00397D8337